jgi:hypothetical protein
MGNICRVAQKPVSGGRLKVSILPGTVRCGLVRTGVYTPLQGDGTSRGGLSFELLLPEGLLMATAAICYGMYILCLSSALFHQNTRS